MLCKQHSTVNMYSYISTQCLNWSKSLTTQFSMNFGQTHAGMINLVTNMLQQAATKMTPPCMVISNSRPSKVAESET